ncbi:hypothetical protein IWW48_006284 [Coemansia sp. RSA 1200]|nr:hypothetical protein IWW48_006284 [Coemansia sp. RSA 1200]
MATRKSKTPIPSVATTRQLHREKRKRSPIEETTVAAALPSTPKRKANKENEANHAENITPVKRRKTREQLAKGAVATTSKAVAANPMVNPTPCKSRTSKSGAVHSYGIQETERDKEAKAYAKYVLEKYTHHNVAEVPRIAASRTGESQTTEETIGLIAESMERLMAGRPLPRNSGLKRKLLMPYVTGLVKWRDVGPSVKSEKPLYDYFANFALFVAQCLQLIAVGDNGNTLDIARLVLPSSRSDFKPNDSNDTRRIDSGLDTRNPDSLVRPVSVDAYVDMLCVLEAKAARDQGDEALVQLFMYSASLYTRQPDRRFLWGLTVCADEIYVCTILNDCVLVSPAMNISESEGRKALVSLLVSWSVCPRDRLGYDPTMERIYSGISSDSSSSSSDDDSIIDDIRYEISCYDDETEETQKYVIRRTIMSADDVFGRHTRCFVATPIDYNLENIAMSGATDGTNLQEVVIKDAWPPAESPVLEDPRSEIVLLRKIRSEFEANPPSPPHIYPKLVVGGHIKLARDNDAYEIDTTDAIFKSMGVERLNPPPGNDEMEALHWRYQPLRAHRRIVMSPVGHSIKTVQNEKELITVLAEAMRCHSSILGRCGILHRDISTNNILVVRPGGHSTGADTDASVFSQPSSSPLPCGLLIDFDFAIEVGISERVARPERSGTLPYMSIANLLNLETERTALDDWESLLYVVCWLATVGICSNDRTTDADLERLQICRWRVGTLEIIADTKRDHMDSTSSFMNLIVRKFRKQYKLLPLLAIALHKALFANPSCPGALVKSEMLDNLVDLDSLDSLDFDQQELGSNDDPLIKRNEYADDIITNLQSVMQKFEHFARKKLSST